MKKGKIFAAALAALLAVTPILATNHPAQAASQSLKGKIVLKNVINSDSIYIYDGNAKALTTHQNIRGRNWTVGVDAKPGSVLTYYSRPVILRGPKKQNSWEVGASRGTKVGYHYEPAAYVRIGDNRYIHSENVSSMNGKGVLILSANSAVYNRRGRRVSYQGQRIIPKYMLVNYAGAVHATKKDDRYFYYANLSGSKEKSLRTYNIRGRQYFSLGSGKYINANNVNMMNGHSLYREGGTATATARIKLSVYNYLLKKTKRTIAAGQKVKVDGTKTSGEGDNTSLWFRLAGTRGKNAQYIYWGDEGQYGYDTESVTDEFQGDFALSVRLAE